MKYLLSLTILLLATQAHADRCKVYKYKIDTHENNMMYYEIMWEIRWSSDKGYKRNKTWNYCHAKMLKKLVKYIKDNSWRDHTKLRCTYNPAEPETISLDDLNYWHRKYETSPKYRYYVQCEIPGSNGTIKVSEAQDDLG